MGSGRSILGLALKGNEMFANIYQGRNVFITGHTGFKGSWLCAWLLNLGANVSGFSLNIPTSPSNFEALRLAEKIKDIRGDVRDFKSLSSAVASCKPDVIFHLAAQPLVRLSYQNPVETFETNMLGVMNILELTRMHQGIKAVIIVTSDKCYRNQEWVWGYRETDRLGGYDPYSASKGCAELIAQSYFQSYFQNGPACATVRAGNVIGGGDWALDRIVPDCARAWAANKPVEIRSPAATRPWQHVLEPLSGYLWLAAMLLSGNEFVRNQSYNFGPPADVNNSVGEVVKKLQRYWPDFKSNFKDESSTDKKECGLLKLCCDKALAQLNWKAVLRFEETIRYTAEWYSRYYAETGQPDMWIYTLGQIAAYVNSAQERSLFWALH